MWRRSYANREFKGLVGSGEHVPYELPDEVHLHYILVNGRPRWVSSLRESDACGTARCREVRLALAAQGR